MNKHHVIVVANWKLSRRHFVYQVGPTARPPHSHKVTFLDFQIWGMLRPSCSQEHCCNINSYVGPEWVEGMRASAGSRVTATELKEGVAGACKYRLRFWCWLYFCTLL